MHLLIHFEELHRYAIQCGLIDNELALSAGAALLPVPRASVPQVAGLGWRELARRVVALKTVLPGADIGKLVSTDLSLLQMEARPLLRTAPQSPHL